MKRNARDWERGRKPPSDPKRVARLCLGFVSIVVGREVSVSRIPYRKGFDQLQVEKQLFHDYFG